MNIMTVAIYMPDVVKNFMFIFELRGDRFYSRVHDLSYPAAQVFADKDWKIITYDKDMGEILSYR